MPVDLGRCATYRSSTESSSHRPDTLLSSIIPTQRVCIRLPRMCGTLEASHQLSATVPLYFPAFSMQTTSRSSKVRLSPALQRRQNRTWVSWSQFERGESPSLTNGVNASEQNVSCQSSWLGDANAGRCAG